MDLLACIIVVPAAAAELNASNLAIDASLLATNRLASRLNVINASITAVDDNITYLHDSSNLQISQINDTCEYYRTYGLMLHA